MLKEVLPTKVNGTLVDILPPWLEACVVLLGRKDVGEEVREEGLMGLAIRKEVFKVGFAFFFFSSFFLWHISRLVGCGIDEWKRRNTFKQQGI